MIDVASSYDFRPGIDTDAYAILARKATIMMEHVIGE
jgi:hypothetical protein